MIGVGDRVELDSGHAFVAEGELASGGQGDVLWGRNLDRAGEQGVLKVFREAGPDDPARVRFLVAARLGRLSPVLRPPTDSLTRGGAVGHYAPRAPGVTLDELLASPGDLTLVEQLQLALAIAHGVARLHGAGFVHGDVQGRNVLVHATGGRVFEVVLIDFDTYGADGAPAAPVMGHPCYAAPEVRAGRQPDARSDAFALAVLLHEVLLFRHPFEGHDATPEEFEAALGAGWALDPRRGAAATARPAAGYAVLTLDATLCGLFRGALEADPARRPPVSAWVPALGQALLRVHVCPACAVPGVADAGKEACPSCAAAYPRLALLLPDGTRVPLDSAAHAVGRDLLGSPSVSRHHAVFRRVGPETWCEPLGRHGTLRWTGSSWVAVPPGRPFLVSRDDRLRLADVEVRVVA